MARPAAQNTKHKPAKFEVTLPWPQGCTDDDKASGRLALRTAARARCCLAARQVLRLRAHAAHGRLRAGGGHRGFSWRDPRLGLGAAAALQAAPYTDAAAARVLLSVLGQGRRYRHVAEQPWPRHCAHVAAPEFEPCDLVLAWRPQPVATPCRALCTNGWDLLSPAAALVYVYCTCTRVGVGVCNSCAPQRLPTRKHLYCSHSHGIAPTPNTSAVWNGNEFFIQVTSRYRFTIGSKAMATVTGQELHGLANKGYMYGDPGERQELRRGVDPSYLVVVWRPSMMFITSMFTQLCTAAFL